MNHIRKVLHVKPKPSVRVRVYNIVEKGGAGSGNFGHAGRPGERGGSGEGGIKNSEPSKKVMFQGKAFTTKAMIEYQKKTPKLDRALDEEYNKALREKHGLTVGGDKAATIPARLAIHEALALQPKGVLKNIRESKTEIRFRNSDENEYVMASNGQQMKFGGYVNYDGNKLVLGDEAAYTDRVNPAGIVSHEMGHLSIRVVGEHLARADALKTHMRHVEGDTYQFGEGDPRKAEAVAKLSGLRKLYEEKYSKVETAFRNFRDATQEENGITAYANSYKGVQESRKFRHSSGIGRDNQFGESEVNDYINENYAEWNSKMRALGADDKFARSYYKKALPKSYKAYKNLTSLLEKPFPRNLSTAY